MSRSLVWALSSRSCAIVPGCVRFSTSLSERIATAPEVESSNVQPLENLSVSLSDAKSELVSRSRSRRLKKESQVRGTSKVTAKRAKDNASRTRRASRATKHTVENAEDSPEHTQNSEPFINNSEIVDIAPPVPQSVPTLAHGLDRVLFNPGVYYLQDPRSHVYNFDPYLQNITPVDDFNYDALTGYITSSRDETLENLAREHGLQVVGSTSSMTSVLAQFHFFVSNWRPVETDRLSSAFFRKSRAFTISQKAPASIYLRHNNGIYAIDADKSLDSGDSVLSFLGRSMEKMLTLDQEEFAKLKKVNKADAPSEKYRESYHYSKIGKILMRSQLDCQDSRLPGTGTFDLKTRAVLPVRMDSKNVQGGAGYQIFQSTGILESFEREYYDMIRAAFLKYSMQVRIGKMDGIFVAYHNTERIFGFQYISLDEMDHCIHGSSEHNIAQREFVMSLRQLDKILELAIQKFPGQSMSLSFETMEDKKSSMRIVIEPMTETDIKRRQEGELLEALRAAQRNEKIKKMPLAKAETNSKATLEKMSSTLERLIALNRAEQNVDVAPDESGDEKTNADAESVPPKRVMLLLKGTNFLNGEPVQGVPDVKKDDVWTFKFNIRTVEDDAKIEPTMRHIRERQAQAFTDIYEVDEKLDIYRNDLKRISDLSRIKLETMLKNQTATPVVWREGDSSKNLEAEYRKNFSA